MTRTYSARVGDLRDRTDDERYTMLVWLAAHHPAVFDAALRSVQS